MADTGTDFDRLSGVAEQHAPHQHGPSPVKVGVATGLLWLGAREYNYRQAIVDGRLPAGWKRNAWGWYAVLGAVLHFVVFVAWYANTITADDVFWPMFLVIGVAIWGPLTLAAFVHHDRIERFNKKLLAKQD